MSTRIYAISNTDGTVRLIEADSAAKALRLVMAVTFTVKVPTQRELVDLLAKGVKVESVAVDTEQP